MNENLIDKKTTTVHEDLVAVYNHAVNPTLPLFLSFGAKKNPKQSSNYLWQRGTWTSQTKVDER